MATMSMDQFEAKLKRWAKNNPADVKNALKAGAEVVRGQSIRKHLSGPKMPVGRGSAKNATLARRSGDLAGSLNTKASVSGAKISAQVSTNLKYARIHEKGGTIRPVRAKALKFQVGGRWVTKQSVTIPARPFLEPALEEKRNDIINLIGTRMVRGYNRS